MIICQHQHKDRRFIFSLSPWWLYYIQLNAKEIQLRMLARKAFNEVLEMMGSEIKEEFPPTQMVLLAYHLVNRWKHA